MFLTVGKRSPSPESRSKSTPPPMPSSQPPSTRSQGPQTYPSLDVNGKSYFVMDKIGKGGSSQVFQVRYRKIFKGNFFHYSSLSNNIVTKFVKI